jgi:hypothetical protein
MTDLRAILKELKEEEKAQLQEHLANVKKRKESVRLRKEHREKLAKRREEKAAENQEITEVLRRARTQKRYHEKNRFRLNQDRARRARRPEQVYNRAKRRAIDRGQTWEFTYDEWYRMWQEAEDVCDPLTGFTKSAWSLKGGNYTNNTQMVRTDLEGPWSVKNCKIMLNGEIL